MDRSHAEGLHVQHQGVLLLTNHPTKRESLYRDLLEELPDDLEDKKNLYREQLPDAAVEEVCSGSTTR